MALSKSWTVQKVVNRVMDGVETSATPRGLDEIRKVDLTQQLNAAVEYVAALFFDLMSQSYMTAATVTIATTGRYYVSGATWTAATRLLTATMDTSFTSGDVGKLIVFRVGTSVYVGVVESYGSATTVVVSGSGLPTTDQTVNYVLLAATAPSSDSADISTLRIMRLGSQVKLELESTSTARVEPLSITALRIIQTSQQNKNKVFWALQGETILLKKGDSLSTYGTLTLRYPRVPTALSAVTDYIDLPDSAVELAYLRLKTVVDGIAGIKADYTSQIEGAIRSLYRSFGGEVDVETIKAKILALK